MLLRSDADAASTAVALSGTEFMGSPVTCRFAAPFQILAKATRKGKPGQGA
jgi:hypothetical protein